MTRSLSLAAMLAMAVLKLTDGSAACAAGSEAAERPGQPPAVEPPASPSQDLSLAPPIFDSGLFPCSDCHADMSTDARPRELRDEHTAIRLRHTAGQLWCLDCHQTQNRDSLRLATGEPIPFTDSYRLCGQCHGEKLRDWQIGLHGKRTGFWNGHKHSLLCTRCHNPHEPKFKAMTPRPPPQRPGRAAH